jgi:hypothetical protein
VDSQSGPQYDMVEGHRHTLITVWSDILDVDICLNCSLLFTPDAAQRSPIWVGFLDVNLTDM